MTFAHPWVLAFLVLPILALAFVWRRHERRVVLPFDHGPARSGRRLRALLDVVECLPHLLLAVVVVVLAGPQQLGEPKSRRVLTNIELCVDISGSMTSSFGEGSRYDAAMHAIDGFLDFRKGDAFGLTFFGNNVLHWTPLTTDVTAIRCAPPFMRPENAPPWFGGTMIGKALLACRKVLTAREEGDRMIILISDGESSDLAGGADEEIARQLRQDRITVYTVHAAEGEIPGEVVNICSITGGEAFAAEDPAALQAVFARIDRMQQTRIEKVTAETQDWFAPWCLVALSLFATSLLCRFGLRYTPW